MTAFFKQSFYGVCYAFNQIVPPPLALAILSLMLSACSTTSKPSLPNVNAGIDSNLNQPNAKQPNKPQTSPSINQSSGTGIGGLAGGSKTLQIPSINGKSISRPLTIGQSNSPVYATGELAIDPKRFAPNGFSQRELSYSSTLNGKTTTISGTERVYQQPNSIVYGVLYDTAKINGKSIKYYDRMWVIHQVAGNHTPLDKLPSAGKATYVGKAFNYDTELSFNYTVDFTKRTGRGWIGGADEASLDEANINHTGIAGDIRADGYYRGTYELNFFGAGAEEIAGKTSPRNGVEYTFGLSGTRGAITP